MVGVSRVVIKESAAELKALMHQQSVAWCQLDFMQAESRNLTKFLKCHDLFPEFLDFLG
jgi:hypothetical protein